MLPVLDTARLDALAEDLGDVEFLWETVDVYLLEMPGRRSAMETAFSGGDRPAMRDGAHSLGSASALLGLLDLQECCRAMESRAVGADDTVLAALFGRWTSSAEAAQRAAANWLLAQGSNR